MAPRKPSNTSQYEDRFFNLLQDTIEGIDTKVDKLSDELKHNTEETQKSSTNFTKLSDQVEQYGAKIKRLEKVVFPDQPKSAKDLPPFYRDPKIITLLTIFATALLVAGYLIGGILGIKLPGLP